MNNGSVMPKLLIVDDAQEIRSLLASIFESEFQIFSAKNGMDGLNAAWHLILNL